MLAVQRLAPIKRVDLLIDVARLLDENHPGEFELVIAGTGDEYERLCARVAQLGLHNVRLLGYVAEADLPALYRRSDVFVSHSLFETFGVMYAQAMATGLPIVAARTSCVPWVVGHQVNGILVDPFDVRAFADAVVTLASDRELHRTIASANQAKAREQYDWDRIAAMTVECFEKARAR
jgi:glycosyltransferase involved in cell wall biosynthesis